MTLTVRLDTDLEQALRQRCASERKAELYDPTTVQ